MSDEGFWFRHRLDVRFSDCDAMGHVNHAVYFTDFEQGRFALYEILHAASGQRLADGKTVNVTFDYVSSRTIAIPEMTRRLLEQARIERWS